jgi:ABC-type multidrug transport system ATPase subunit
VTRPRLLLLDEPTEGIQPSVVAEIEETILALSRRGGLSVLLVEQHVGFAMRAAQRYYVLEAGRVTSSGEGGTGAEQTVRAALSVERAVRAPPAAGKALGGPAARRGSVRCGARATWWRSRRGPLLVDLAAGMTG